MVTVRCSPHVWLLTVSLFFLINLRISGAHKRYEGERELACEKHLKEVLVRPSFDMVGAALMENYEPNGTGFVYSEFKIHHKLFQLYKPLSMWSKYIMSLYLGLDQEICQSWHICRGFANIVEDINGRHNFSTFLYTSWILSGRLSDSMDACCTEVDFNFRNITPAAATARVNQLYSDYCNSSLYLTHELDIRSRFYLASPFRATPKLFGESKIIEDDFPFTDLNGTDHIMNWVKLTGEFWFGGRNRGYEDKTSVCKTVKLIHSEIENGTLYMLYIQPLFREETTAEKIKCFTEIFSNLRSYITKAINKESSSTFQIYTSDKLGVPLMDLSTDLDLKPILENNMSSLFQEDRLFGIEEETLTLHELRTWEYCDNRPSEHEFPQDFPPVVDYIRTPFAFALVDKPTHIVLKAGAYLRPKV